MKLLILGEHEDYKRQIELICKLFIEENDELFFINKDLISDETDQIMIDLQYSCYDEKVIVICKASLNKKSYYFSYNRYFKETGIIFKNKIISKGISIVLLKTLEEITGKKQGWGILTGIRPVKLYHKLYRQTKSHDIVHKELRENYLLKEDKITLMNQIVDKQLEILPDLYKKYQEVSIYIGIPFCPTRCVYCTFPAYAINRKDKSIEGFISALLIEIDILGKWLRESRLKVTTIYFGGGTPTSLEAKEIDQIFCHLSNYIDLNLVEEITIEAGRPDTITVEKLDIMNKWRVDRISINPQTFTQKTLDLIGRNHAANEVNEKYILARQKGINNINMDLIIGLPEERIEDIENTLLNVAKLSPDSLTIHTMAFKTASNLVKNKKDYSITEREEINKMMNFARDWAKDHKYHPYYLYRQKNILGNLENIGYSKSGKESLYNILMMEEKQTIVALGCGAVSKLITTNTDQVMRVPNPKDWKTYIENVEKLAMNKITKLDEIFTEYS